jgi:subtilisin family serine protease
MNRFRFTGRLLLALAAVAPVASGALSAQAPLDPNVIKQMKEIYSFKASLTPAEAKLSTNLVLLTRLAKGTLPANMMRYVPQAVRDSNGKFAVEVHGLKTSAFMDSASRAGIAMTDGATPMSAVRSGRFHARVSDSELLKLAQQDDVTSVREAAHAQTNVGSVTSQGYVAMGANKVVPTGVTGSGIRVGVLSDSAYPAQVASLIASGDLPADVTVVPGQAGPTDNSGENEGTAMMEIVHDMAPDAKIFFASAFNGEDSFAANIRTLRNTYGCDIIVDDVSYSDEAAFQDGEIAQAVNDVTASGALYFSSAANSGNLSSGTSGTWEGDFTPGGTSGTLISTNEGGPVVLHNFSTTATPQTYDVLTASTTDIVLHWSDALGAASNDYDFFLLNSAGTSITTYSANPQTGTQDPIEELYTGKTFAAGSRVVVALYNGLPRALHVDTERGRLSIATSGATIGHNAGASTFSTAAVYWQAAHKGVAAFTGGPTNPDETFSSDGPRKIFYNPDGTPITPGNYLFSTSGGKTLIKPDAAGADGVVTKTAGFNPFFGTSAAAPHAAGVAALVKSANPTLTNTQIRNILTSTALDNMEAGVDRDSGYGIVTAPAAVAAAKAAAASSAAAK